MARVTSPLLPLLLAFSIVSTVSSAPSGDGSTEILTVSAIGKIGSTSNITCVYTPPDAQIEWTFNRVPFVITSNDTKFRIESDRGSIITPDENMIYFQRISLIIPITKTEDHGLYSCRIVDRLDLEESAMLNLSFPIRVVQHDEVPVKVKISSSTFLSCIFEGFNLTEVKWRKRMQNMTLEKIDLKNKIRYTKLNETHINGTLEINDVNKQDNGTYICGVRDNSLNQMIVEDLHLLVLDKPHISIDFVKAIGASSIYLNWTVNDGNSPIDKFLLQFNENGTETWTYSSTPIKGTNVSFVAENFKPSCSYKIKIIAFNSEGSGSYLHNRWVKTLAEDPVFVPEVKANGFTMSSISITWNAPPENLSEYIHYYELIAKEQNSRADRKEALHSGGQQNYMFENLEPSTVYVFTVRACSEFTSKCGNWSVPVNGSTSDGIAGPPTIISLSCKNDNISGTNFIYVSWKPPDKINGKIIRYNVQVTGTASYVNGNGAIEQTTWGPKKKSTAPETLSARFDTMPANTNYTVIVTAVTRSKHDGKPVMMQCMTPPSTPPRNSLSGIKWNKVQEGNGRWLFQLNIPRVTERNGAICCYRIFIVRMKNKQLLNNMPSPEHLLISSYNKVHNGKQGAGAYIAEVFTSATLESNIILGDGITYVAQSPDTWQQCALCASVLPNKVEIETTTTTSTTSTQLTTSVDKITTIEPKSVDPTVNPTIITENEAITEIVKVPEKPPSDTLKVTEGSSQEEKIATSTEKSESKSHHLKKKKKMKRQDPSLESKQHYQKYDNQKSLHSYDHETSKFDSLDSIQNDDPRFSLNHDFYANKRISHQNKRPYIYESNYNVDREDSIKDDDLSDLENDDTVVSDGDELIYEYSNRRIEDDSYLKGHKIISRQVIDDFAKTMSNLKKSPAINDEDEEEDDDEEVGSYSSRISDNEKDESEEIVDASEIEEKTQGTPNEIAIYDGQLDEDSNYTGFLELLVHPGNEKKMVPMYSDYFTVLKPGPNNMENPDDMYNLILKVTIGCVVVMLVLLIIFCVIHNQIGRKARQHGVEMHTLRHTLRNIYQGFKDGRHQLVTHSPPDMPPITKENLLAAFTERQADSGYGFQVEFEMLPDCFPDRTMDASEAKENQNKNRYPDIKAYDQTRVKLSQIDSVVGSDYINANIVMGYKERKRFICAQGPTDVTVDDFWRMIWEYNLELVVMLTNLEEYSKVKCSKYWPDQNQQDKMFNNISVHHVSEKRYSDYIIRELKISKQALSTSNSNNQIIEANGGPKRNGVTEGSNGISSSNGTSEERIVHQYHFLMWKDFVAPEYPYAILKFIKRMNEACTAGRPILVHCSAGVGRTGTLVALDCLLQQLSAENQVAVFNTVCDLRRQRNFLVQSLKQYVFVYRALVEYGQYDDTEIPASRLKTTIDRLRQTAENSDTCLMEEEFEKLKQPILEIVKPCAAGRSPEHIAKNRNEAVIPYDHNRVILAPIATKENSTYINATFIEGYDNSESYIIAQDPMPSTIADFWRMVFEQEINTIVMLSELGEGKCPRYWDDDEIQYDHINITYLISESCPYYTRREFQVTNMKNQDTIKVTQLQYHGWPTVSGQVPEVTRGLIELVGQCGINVPATPPILVHCSHGTDRSSMFVALSILTIQLRTERRVDISTVTRKLRSQRMGCLDTFLQYEFLHRAIVNYAELHNLLSDS